MSATGHTPARLLPLALVTACLVVMGCQATPPVAVSGATAAPGTDLAGQVLLPVDVVGEAAVIPTGIGRVIPTGVGRVIPTGVGRYRIQAQPGGFRIRALGEELPVTGALVMAFDAVTHQALPNVAPVATDERGGFVLHGVPAGPVVIEAIAAVGADEFHLLAFSGAASAPVAVSWRSTAVVEPLVERSDTAWTTLTPDELQRQEAAVATQAEGLAPGDRLALITGALKHPLPVPIGPLPSPAPSAEGSSASPNAAGGVGAIASAVPAIVASTVPAVVTSTVPQILSSTVPQVLTSTVPTVLTSTIPSIVASTVPLVGGAVGGVTQTVGEATQPVTNTVTQVTQTVTGVLSPLLPTPKPSSKHSLL
jgi:hypothetical protein